MWTSVIVYTANVVINKSQANNISEKESLLCWTKEKTSFRQRLVTQKIGADISSTGLLGVIFAHPLILNTSQQFLSLL